MLEELPVKPHEIRCSRKHFSTIMHPEKLVGLAQSTVQKKGEMVIVFSGVYHSGVNLGTNICATGSLASEGWLKQRIIPNCKCPFQLTNKMVEKLK